MPDERTPVTAERTAEDHRAIARLADDLLPALIAKLAASGLGEIEVREGGWKARLRKAPGVPEEPRRGAGWGSGAQGHSGHAHASGHGPAEVVRRPWDEADEDDSEEASRTAATSPAVGIYHPRRDLTVGMRIREGDPIGTIDVLGVREEVVAPIDGIIGASLAEAGEAVEFGQELVRIELPQRGGSDRQRAGVDGSAPEAAEAELDASSPATAGGPR